MPPAIAGTRAIARKLCTGMNGLSQCESSHWPYGGMCPQIRSGFFTDEFQHKSVKGCGIFSKILFYLVVLGRLELNNARNVCILKSDF